MKNGRLSDLKKFYELLVELEKIIGGARKLSECSGSMDWPERGVYFFQEDGENRSDTGQGPRIVRVGTSKTLWKRLRQHKGTLTGIFRGGGNHRISAFRKLVGNALIERDNRPCSTWEQGKPISKAVKESEHQLEQEVSNVIGDMPFLWLTVNDEPSPESDRGFIERNAIALLSNFKKEALDQWSDGWLGKHCSRDRVKESRLWNSNHVSEDYDPNFLETMENYIRLMGKTDN